MKKILTLLTVLAAAALCFFLASASPPAMAAEKPEVKNVKILIVGSPLVGVSALAERIAAKGAAVVIVRSDGDDSAVSGASVPVIANKFGTISIATAARIKPLIRRKTETRCKSVSNFTDKTFYDLPPNDYGYSGVSFANLTRDSSQS